MNNTLILEIPIDGKDAKRRGINESLCRLLLHLDERMDHYHSFAAKLIYLNKPVNKEICIVPYGIFKEFRELNIQKGDYSYNSQLNYCVVRDNELLVPILKGWEAEELIFFYSSEKLCTDLLDKIKSSEPKFFKLSKGGYELPFLKQIDVCELFLFYSISRSSFEIIGNKVNVMGVFERIQHLV